MATNWIGGTGGWNTLANWSGGIPNAGTADATIAIPGTVTLEAGTIDQVDTLLINNTAATLNLAGTLALGGPFAFLDVAAGELLLAGNLSGGTLALGSGSTLADSGGTFTGALDAAAGSTINLGGSTLDISGRGFDRASVTGAGTLAISGIYDVGGLALSGGQTLLIAAGLAVQDGAATLNAAGTGSSLLTIANGGFYEINAGGQSIASNGTASIVNSGLFTKANDDGTNTVDASFTNTSGGMLTVPRGVLDLQDGGVLGGILNGGGELELGGGTFTLDASSDSLGTLALNGASVTLGAAQSFAGTFLDDNFATLALAGQNLTLSGLADLTSAYIDGAGGLTFSGSGALEYVDFVNGVSVTDTGSFNQTGGISVFDGASFTVAAGADYDFTSDSSLIAVNTIDIAGELERTAGGTGISYVYAPVANTGLILDLFSALDFADSINNAGLIESTGPGDLILSTVTGAGTIAVIDSETTLGGPVSAGQIISFSGTGDIVTLSDASAMDGTINGFAPTDTIAFSGISVTPGTYTVSSGGLLTLPVTGGSPITLTFAAAADNLAVTLTANGSVVDATTAIPAAATSTEWDTSSGDWNSGNWSNGIPNASTINAAIAIYGDYTVTLGHTDSYTVGNLLFHNYGGTLALEGALTAQALTLVAGELLDSGVFTGALNANAGSTIDLASTNLTVSGDGAIGAGITGAGSLVITGLYEVGGQTVGSGITELIEGVAIQDGTATFAAGALLRIATGGVYDVNADSQAISSPGLFVITNSGLFTKADDPGTTDVEGAITNTSNGVITVPAGVLDFLQGGILNGAIDGPGEVLLGAGTFTLASSDDTIGTLGIGAANVVLGANQSLSSNVFTTTGSTISLNGHNLTLSGTSSLAGADVAGTGTLYVSGTGETNGTSFGSGATFLDSGSINQDGALTIAPGAGFSIAPNADYDLTSDTGITDSGTITLDGELEKTAGTGESTITAPVSIASNGYVLGLSGDMDFTAPVTNNGLIQSSGPGNITLSTVTGGGMLEMLDSDMTLNGPAAPGQFMSFAGTGDVLTLNDPADMQGTITGFGPTDTIVMAGLTLVPGVYTVSSNGTLDLPETDGATLALNFARDDYFYPFTIASAPESFHAITACFAAGTRILTADGRLVPVEHLREGESLETHGGEAADITWIGRRTIDLTRHPRPEAVQPILISAGALGRSIPWRDLVVSPDHAMYLHGHLIPAKTLLNGFSIRQLNRATVTYYHIEFLHHTVLFAEGAAAESYLDTGNRSAFENAGQALLLHPDFAQTLRETAGCAPFAESGPAVEAVRQQILDRSNIETTDDPDLTIHYQNGAAIIQSRSAIPGELFANPTDRRRLGVKISCLQIAGREISLDHESLTEGWHNPEPDGRWTTGRAIIPAELLAGARDVQVTLAGAMRYPAPRASVGWVSAALPITFGRSKN